MKVVAGMASLMLPALHSSPTLLCWFLSHNTLNQADCFFLSYKPGVVVHTFNPTALEAEAELVSTE